MNDADSIFAIFDAIEEINGAKSPEDLVAIVDKRTRAMGIEQHMIGQISGPRTREPLLAGTYNKEWQARFFANKYENKDPTILTLIAGEEGFSIKGLTQDQDRGTIGWQIMHEATEFGIRDGWAFAIPGFNGFLSAVSFVGDKLDDNPRTRLALRLLGLAAHAKLFSLVQPIEEAVPTLSNREKEVLQWIAAGLKDEAISQKMHIAKSTVHMHIERAKTKLGATKRTQAVVEALRQYQILI